MSDNDKGFDPSEILFSFPARDKDGNRIETDAQVAKSAGKPKQGLLKVITTRVETAQNLKALVDDIAKRGAPGHSFSIELDPESGHGGKHGFDGDGVDHILGAEVEETVAKSIAAVVKRIVGVDG